jgi:hypothetical protein
MMQNLTFTAPTSYTRIHSFIRLFGPEPLRYRANFVLRKIAQLNLRTITREKHKDPEFKE